MKKGFFIKTIDWHSHDLHKADIRQGNYYQDKFVAEMVDDFYNEWYNIYVTDYYTHLDMSTRQLSLCVKFDYTSHIKPRLTECIEYMISNLEAA